MRVSKDWLGGSPRVTISRNGDLAVLKLLGTRKKTGTKRLDNSNQCETIAKNIVELSIDDTSLILKTALSMANTAKDCWVWDSCDIGVARLHNISATTDDEFNDDIGF